MANGDTALAAGMAVVPGTADRRNGYDEVNRTRDYIALYAAGGSALGRWRAKLGADPATSKVVFLGDSTTSNAPDLFNNLRTYYTKTGMPLAGVPSANIVNGGNNGASLAVWNTDAAGPNTLPYSGASLIADAPDLVVACWLLNDVRLGGATIADCVARLDTLLDFIRTNLPNADVLLRMPNSMTTTGSSLVSGITHQAATNIIRAAHLRMVGRRAHVDVIDLQAALYGTTVRTTSPYMVDELHPNSSGYSAAAHVLGRYIGLASSPVLTRYGFHAVGYVTAAGAGYMDITCLPVDPLMPPGREWPLTSADTLTFSDGTSVDLTSASFVSSGDNVRILKSGTWTALAGTTVHVDTGRPGPGAREGKYFATLDPPSIAANSKADVTVTIAGITQDMGVIAQPPSSLLATGILWAAVVSNVNTVTVRLHNPTAAAIDLASDSGWRFFIVR